MPKVTLRNASRDGTHPNQYLEQGMAALLELKLPAAEAHFRQVLADTPETDTSIIGTSETDTSEDALALGYAYQGLGDVAAVRRNIHEAHYYFQKSQQHLEQAGAYRALHKVKARLRLLGAE